MRFGFIAKHRGIWPLRWMCEVLDVSPSGFYSWLSRGPSRRATLDEVLVGEVRRSFEASGDTYGVRRVWPDLLGWGFDVGRERVARLMRRERLVARPLRRKQPRDGGSRDEQALAPNHLDREFIAMHRISVGWRTSPTFGRPRAGCLLRWSSTCSHAASRAGR